MGKIVSIHSYRGGTGKSNTTANVATAIALMGQRVGVVDTDIQSPGIHVLFDLEPEKTNQTLNDFLWGRCSIKDAAYDVTPADVKAKNGQIFLIPSSIKASDISRVLREGYDVELLNEGFSDAIDLLQLDYLFVDTHPGLNEETLLSASISDVLVLILRPDKQDFQGTAVTVDVARKLGVPRMLLVVNRALPIFNFADLRKQVETTYDVPVGGVLPNSDDMMQLASSGLFYLKYPDHAISKEVQAIAYNIHN